jgi:predicted MPP superfamily phosphohydrolase
MFPVTLIGKLFFPYIRGLYHHKGTTLFVSQGAGTYGPPMRLGTKNEIALLRLIGRGAQRIDSDKQGGIQ